MIIQNFFKAVNNGGEMQPYFGRVFEKMRIVLKKKQYYAQILKLTGRNSLECM